MVKFIVGSVFDSERPALGHGVNTMGIMGSGIAPLIRKAHPAVFTPYEKACKDGSLIGGGMLPVETEPGFWVLNLASQELPGANANLEFLEESLISAFEFVQSHNIDGFALPRIGAGVGGLEWADVRASVIDIASRFPNILLEVWILPHEVDPMVDGNLEEN